MNISRVIKYSRTIPDANGEPFELIAVAEVNIVLNHHTEITKSSLISLRDFLDGTVLNWLDKAEDAIAIEDTSPYD